jgi:hypothetical protein
MVGEMFSINEASGIPFRAAYGILEELRKLLMMNKTEDVNLVNCLLSTAVSS